MIPKLVHYVWLSGEPLSPVAQKCIKSWEKAMPGFEIRSWTAENFDFSDMPAYVREAVALKKWAFATDYLRLYAVYRYGGIYLDSDVFMLKSLEPLLDAPYFSFIEHHEPAYSENRALFDSEGRSLTDKHVPGLGIQAACWGAEAGHPFLKTCMDYYENRSFTDNAGRPVIDMVVPDVYALCARDAGFRYLDHEQKLDCGIRLCSSKLFAGCMTEYEKGAYGVHLCAGSWRDKGWVKDKALKLALRASVAWLSVQS